LDENDQHKQERPSVSDLSFGLIVRYGFVGAFNTLVSYSVYCLLLYLGANYAVASLGALVFGIMLSFVTLGRYVFMSRLKGRFPMFLIVWAVLYFVNIGIISFVLSFGIDAYTAGLIAAVPTISLAFLLQRFYVFRR
jgi:putative flippase GtrA